MTQNLVWLIPSFHGDIRLESQGDRTILHAYELTAWEEKAMEVLRARALGREFFRKPWAKESSFLPLTNAAYRMKDGVTVELEAKIGDIEKVLSKALRPERQLVKAVKYTDGTVREIQTYRSPAEPDERDKLLPPAPEKPKAELAKPEPETATTVARPVNGCPMPDFPEADIRASRVLEAFLSPAQVKDYQATGAFMTIGADTGRRYMIGNRERPQYLAEHFFGRQLYDMDLGRALCVHDWAVPPPEEMLALHLCISLPGRESELLSLPEIDPSLAFADVDPYHG
jgi:hypothetical protein